MAEWKRRSSQVDVDVRVDLTDVDDADLLQALIDKGRLTEGDAAAILASKPLKDVPKAIGGELDDARADILVGRKTEALINIERFLGAPFIGRLA